MCCQSMRHRPLDIAVIIGRHIRVDGRPSQRAATHLRPAIDPCVPSINPQSELEDQLCVPVLNIDGDSYRMRSHRARAEATRNAVKDS